MTREERIEAVADAWASIDGNVDDFRAGKTAPSIEDYGGRYAGYMADAEELVERIAKRGYVLVPREPAEEMVAAADRHLAVHGYYGGTREVYRVMLQAYLPQIWEEADGA